AISRSTTCPTSGRLGKENLSSTGGPDFAELTPATISARSCPPGFAAAFLAFLSPWACPPLALPVSFDPHPATPSTRPAASATSRPARKKVSAFRTFTGHSRDQGARNVPRLRATKHALLMRFAQLLTRCTSGTQRRLVYRLYLFPEVTEVPLPIAVLAKP